MIRISGIVLPDNKPVTIGLTAVFGIGRKTAQKIVTDANVDAKKRIKELTIQEETRIRNLIEKNVTVEGDLRSDISANIRRLKDISAYRGTRHSRNLPVNGQRTKTNARTKRGKKVTVGSGRKKSAEKT